MTNRNLLDTFGDVSLDLIAEAAPDEGRKKRSIRAWVKWTAVAAASLALILSIGIPMGLHGVPEQTTVDELYPFDSIRVGESAAFGLEYSGGISGTVTYDSLDDSSFSVTVTVNESNEYEHDPYLNHYVELEINGQYVAEERESADAYPLLDVYVNGERQDEYDFGFLREAGTYHVTVQFTRLLEAEGRAVLCDFVFPGLVAFEVYHFEEGD